MKQTVLFAALGLAAFGATAQEVGQVISATPVIEQVAVPRQVCNNRPMVVQPPTTGGGGFLGALTGAAIGSQVGHGGGTGGGGLVGTIGGALIGNNVEAANSRQVQMVPECSTQTTYENRTVAWNVVYEYGGRQYSTQMPYDPGPTIRLQMTPVGGSDGNAPARAQGNNGLVVTAPPITQAQAQVQPQVQMQPQVQAQAPVTVVEPAVVYQQPYAGYPAYPAAYPAYPYPAYPYPAYGYGYPWYPAVSFGFGYYWGGGGHGHGGHGHGRH
jgi:uncharacterized protein YcfJ